MVDLQKAIGQHLRARGFALIGNDVECERVGAEIVAMVHAHDAAAKRAAYADADQARATKGVADLRAQAGLGLANQAAQYGQGVAIGQGLVNQTSQLGQAQAVLYGLRNAAQIVLRPDLLAKIRQGKSSRDLFAAVLEDAKEAVRGSGVDHEAAKAVEESTFREWADPRAPDPRDDATMAERAEMAARDQDLMAEAMQADFVQGHAPESLKHYTFSIGDVVFELWALTDSDAMSRANREVHATPGGFPFFGHWVADAPRAFVWRAVEQFEQAAATKAALAENCHNDPEPFRSAFQVDRGLTAPELRLECLRLAINHGDGVPTAKAYSDFVLKG